MSATVTWSLKGSPSCSWASLLGEGSTSLKTPIPLPSLWIDHLSCSSQFAGLLSSPSCSSWDVAFLLSCLSMSLIHALKIGRMVMSVIYYNLGINNLKSCDVWMICNVTDVVWHGRVCSCVLSVLSETIMSCLHGSCVCPGGVI